MLKAKDQTNWPIQSHKNPQWLRYQLTSPLLFKWTNPDLQGGHLTNSISDKKSHYEVCEEPDSQALSLAVLTFKLNNNPAK
jgi:hypothetical protein